VLSLSSDAGGGGVVLVPAEPASLCLSSEVDSAVLVSAEPEVACLSEVEAAASVSTGFEDASEPAVAGGDEVGVVEVFCTDFGAVRAWHQPEPEPPPQAAHDSGEGIFEK